MDLASEDELRLQVLLVNAEAIRIDEQQGIVYGLTASGELQATLNLSGQPSRYFDTVRQYLSTAVLGSPRHFPSHLRRWAGMGQMQNAPLEKLLLLGDLDAAYAVACSQNLTPDLARKVWWITPSVDTARILLRNPLIVNSTQGTVLAAWLVEYLPFETNPADILESTRLLLQSNLVDDDTRRRLWDRGRREKSFRVAFLLQVPEGLPSIAAPLQLAEETLARCVTLQRSGNSVAKFLMHIATGQAQSFIATVADVLATARHQEEVIMTLRAVRAYFSPLNNEGIYFRSVEQLNARAEDGPENSRLVNEICAVSQLVPELAPHARAAAILAHIDDSLITTTFARSSAGGTVMRLQLTSEIRVISNSISVLQSASTA